jgi:hypothetical protein
MGGHGASVALAIILAASLSGCVHRWVLSESPPDSPKARGGARPEDPELHQLLTARRQLVERLHRVEQQLAALASQTADDGGKVDALLGDRLSITVALVDLDEAIDWRREALADQAATALPAKPAEVPPTDPAILMARAAQRVAAHRGAARRGAMKKSVSNRGLLGLLGTAGAGEGSSVADLLTRAGHGRHDLAEELATEGGNDLGGRDKQDDLDALLGQPGKGRGGSKATSGKRKVDKKKRELGVSGPGDAGEDDQTTMKAAVVETGAPPPEVMPALRRYRAPLAACLRPELRDAGVRITVRTRIATDGSFRAPRITATPELSPQVSSCLADVIQRIQLPPQDNSRSVRFSLRFRGP